MQKWILCSTFIWGLAGIQASADILSNLMVHISFDQADLTDDSGLGASGAPVGTPSFSFDATRGSTVFNVLGDNYGEIPINASTPAYPTGSAPRTYALWAKSNTYVRDGGFFHSGTSGPDFSDFSFEQTTTEGIVHFNGWFADFPMIIPSDPYDWHHFAFTFDGSTIRGYVDGNEAGSLVAPLNTPNNAIRLGGPRFNPRRGGADAALDDFRIYGRVLTQPEIVELMSVPPPVPDMEITDIAQLPDGSFRIAWPTVPDGFNLQSTDQIEGGFTNNPVAVVVEGEVNVAIDPAPVPYRAYRLAKPGM